MENFNYNRIAKDYHFKRIKPWKTLENFLSYLREKEYSFNGFCVDLGCANGRHFIIFKTSKNKLIGIDNSLEFLKIAKERLRDNSQYNKNESDNIQLILGDLNFIPVRSQSIQTFFSIATIHHIKGIKKRQSAISQMFNLLNTNGFFLLSVWRRWQENLKKYFIFDWFKRKFNPKFKKQQKNLDLKDFGDRFVPWTISKEKKTYNRFYHFFSRREMLKLLKLFKIKELKKIGGPGNEDNFFILAQK